MQVAVDDFLIHAFDPSDGSESDAIRVVHKSSRHEVISNEDVSQWHNCRRALIQLCAAMNPNPDHIPPPKLMLFDHVRVSLPQSVHEGQVTKLSWDFTRAEWQYFVQCPVHAVTTWYISADLQWLDPNEDEDDEV